jgi:hypothetical protein
MTPGTSPNTTTFSAVATHTSNSEVDSKKKVPSDRSDWLRNYKCSMRKCVSPITEGWKRPDGGSAQSGRMMAIFETGFYVVGIVHAINKRNLSLTALQGMVLRCR